MAASTAGVKTLREGWAMATTHSLIVPIPVEVVRPTAWHVFLPVIVRPVSAFQASFTAQPVSWFRSAAGQLHQHLHRPLHLSAVGLWRRCHQHTAQSDAYLLDGQPLHAGPLRLRWCDHRDGDRCRLMSSSLRRSSSTAALRPMMRGSSTVRPRWAAIRRPSRTAISAA